MRQSQAILVPWNSEVKADCTLDLWGQNNCLISGLSGAHLWMPLQVVICTMLLQGLLYIMHVTHIDLTYIMTLIYCGSTNPNASCIPNNRL